MTNRTIFPLFVVSFFIAELALFAATNVAYAAPTARTGVSFHLQAQQNSDTVLDSSKVTKTVDPNEEPESDVIIHRINMGVSNAYLIETDEGLILVDAGLPFSERLIMRKMKEIGRDDLSLIYITHAHIDHYGSAKALSEKTGAPIAIHKDDAAAMERGRTELGMVRDWERTSKLTLPFIEPLLKAQPTKADILLEEGDSLEEYGVNAYVVHTPGHTPGSTTLVVDDQYGFVGDLVTSSGHEARAQRSFAEDWNQIADSIDKVDALDLDLLFAGHGSEPIEGDDLEELSPRFIDDET